MVRMIQICLCVLALAGCSALPNRSSGSSGAAPSRQTASTPVFRSPEASQCLAELGQIGALYTPLPDKYISPGCTNLNTVQLTALRADNAEVAIANLGPVTCEVSRAFGGWARYGVDRAARQILGSPLLRIETFGSFSCRNVAGTRRRSAHATAAAIDVSGFLLADGRRITVKSSWDNGTLAEREFLRVVEQSACKRFGTVLGPDYNADHRDHFHVEGVNEGSSYCR
jgi:hypothetical protein